MTAYYLSDQAKEQTAKIMAWSEDRHGPRHALHYESLILAAFEDIASEPRRPGAEPVPRTAGVWVYELRFSRNRLPRGQRIRDPWHKIVYRPLLDGSVEILAVVGLSYPSGRAAREAMRAG